MARADVLHPVIAGTANWQLATAEYVNRLRDHYGERLAAVVLYGSRARGDADQESDVDLLVVLCGAFDHDIEQQIVSDLAHDLEATYAYPLIGAIVATETDYRRRMLPLFMNVRREGIELWPIGAKRAGDERAEYDPESRSDLEMVMARAREALGEAQFGLDHAHYRWAANRAYYAMFHATTALLLRDGLAFSKHRGVIAAFNERFVATGSFSASLGGQLGRAFKARNVADYSYREGISANVAAGLVRSAQAFIAEAERLLAT